MKPALILKELRELNEAWRRQNFSYTNEQKKKYEELTKLRRERVKEMVKNGQVHKAGVSNK